MPRDPNEPIPLTQWIEGRMRVHFSGGHIADLSMSLHGAHSLRRQIEDKQGADAIGGLHAHSGWVWARDDEVVMAEWVPTADYGWPDLTMEDRVRLDGLALQSGVLQATTDIWARKRRHKAAYSVHAMSVLHAIAVREPGLTRAQWEEMAELLEGAEGAAVAEDAWRRLVEPAEPPPHDVRDEHIADEQDPEGGPVADTEQDKAGPADDRATDGDNDQSGPEPRAEPADKSANDDQSGRRV